MARFATVRVWVAATAAALSVGVLSAGPAAADPPAPPGTPTATSFAGTPTVGALFRDGVDSDHGCSASVIASPGHDEVLTAAHCVYGTAAGWQFAPGYDDGATPYGVWSVTHAYVAPQWASGQDPQHDYAVLTLARQRLGGRTVGVQDVTGADLLGQAPAPGTTITDVAYNVGLDDQPVRCTVAVYWTGGYPSFDCHGYVGGSSGSPWLAKGPGQLAHVVGVIGGLHQGGCYEYTSYSPAFGPDVHRLIVRATHGDHPDTVPEPGGDGC